MKKIKNTKTVCNTMPVSARRLRGIRSAQSLTSSALEQTNPLRSLTIARAVGMLEAAQRGELTIAQWTLWHIEQTDPDLFALISRRVSALTEMDWNIKTVEGDNIDQALADDQAALLRAAYEKIDNFSEAVEELALAFCRGFTILQIERVEDALHLGPYRPWNILRDGMFGDFYFNPQAKCVSIRAIPAENRIARESHIIYEPRSNLMRIAIIKFIRSNLSQKDWDAFIEIYGLPSAFVIMPPNVPADQAAQYEASALEAAEGGGGALPNGADVKFANEPRGINPFRDHLQFLQQQLILAGTGGLLTMLSMPTGIGDGASDSHDETFKSIARSEAQKISNVFQKQFDLPVLRNKFPGRPRLAYFELASREEQDIGQVIKHAFELAQAGYRMALGELSEKTGYAISEAPLNAGGAGQPGFLLPNTAPASAGYSANALTVPPPVGRALTERAATLDPIARQIEVAATRENLSEPQRLSLIEKLIAQMPDLLPLDAAAAGAEELEKLLADAIVKTLNEVSE